MQRKWIPAGTRWIRSAAVPNMRGRPMPESTSSYRPIAIGFHLLSVPLVVAIFVAPEPTGAWTNAIAAAAMVACGLLLQWKAR